MPRITVYVDDDTAEWLDAENDRTGKSKAKLGGECIELIRSDVDHIEEARSDVMRTASTSRLDEIEERLGELEQRIESSPNAHERDARSGPGHAAHGSVTDEPSDMAEQKQSDDAHSGSESSPIGKVLDGWEPEGEVNSNRAREEAERAAEWLRENGGRHKRQQMTDALADDSALSERVWWERAVQPGLRELDDVGVVEYRAGYHDYKWTG